MSTTDSRPLLHVVAGIILNGKGEYLLSSRPAGKPYAGYWEFAGGKVEAGESETAALQREFEEELGIRIHAAVPWLCRVHSYEHARVRLRFYRVAADQWSGDIQAREGQAWSWQKAGDFTVSPMLPANGPLLKALSVPTELALSADGAKKWMDHTEGAGLGRRVGEILRRLGDLAKLLHLAVSAPAAMAALTARWCNTLTIDFYELGNTGMGVREYIRVLRTESGNKSPITGVFPQGVPQVDEVRKLINLTPHDVTYYPEAGEPFTWAAPEGPDQWVRRQEQSEELPSLRVQGREIPVTRIRQGTIAPEPDPMPGVGYIVPRGSGRRRPARGAAAHRTRRRPAGDPAGTQHRAGRPSAAGDWAQPR